MTGIRFFSITFRGQPWIKDLSDNLLSGLRVFLLEDEYLIAMDVEMLCMDNGAAEVIVKHQLDDSNSGDPLPDFDVAVVDLVLSGKSTLPFAEKLAELGRPFVFASGYTDSIDVNRRFPGVPIVAKPYAGPELVQAIASAARSRNGVANL